MLSLDSNTCHAVIAPERGAIVTSLQVEQQELLYLDQSTFDDPGKNVRGGIPVLFPICGPLDGSNYSWGGHSYGLKQHGFARSLVWNVLEHNSNHALLELVDTETTRAQYPFSFSYRLLYRLTEAGLRIEQSLANRSDQPIPVQFGFHPYFLVGEKEKLRFQLPVTSYDDNKSDRKGDFTGFNFSRDEIDWAFPYPTGPTATFEDSSRGLIVTVSYGEEYQTLVFWTLRDAPFVCIEPWSSSRLAFPNGPDVHRIPAQGTLQTFVEIKAEIRG